MTSYGLLESQNQKIKAIALVTEIVSEHQLVAQFYFDVFVLGLKSLTVKSVPLGTKTPSSSVCYVG